MQDTLDALEKAKSSNAISEATYSNTKSWLTNDQLADFHEAIVSIIKKAAWQELADAFYTQIEFGTAGIRGRTGLGSARINRWTVGTATQGLADYIATQGAEAKERGVVIGSDTRLTSPEFVDLVANILTANEIKVYRFIRPPQVGMFSFAVRLYKTIAGIYISASHNPPTDNGLKIYWEDGAQVLPPHDKAITEAVKAVQSVKDTPSESGDNKVTQIGDQFDTVYRARVLQESVASSRSAKVVYSPFHGTGQYGVLPVLQEAGFEVITVSEQMKPDGNFPGITDNLPNPENKASNDLVMKYVKEHQADVGIATDPDADRIGVVVPRGDESVILDGNQTVNLLTYFVAHCLKEANQLPSNGFVVRNLTTTALVDAIGESFGLKVYTDVPVGFKYIGEQIREHEDFGDEIHIYSGEESMGSLKGSYSRDKDSSIAGLLTAEMVSWLKDQKKTVWDLFNKLYTNYGYYHNDVLGITYEGATGFAKMAKLMASLRTKPPKTIGAWPVDSLIDRQTNERKDLAGKVTGTVTGHTTNALVFNLSSDGKTRAIVRPSGTEPKVKIYVALYNAKAKGLTDVDAVIDETKKQAEELKTALKELAESLTKEEL